MPVERWRGANIDLYLEAGEEVVVFDPISWQTHLLSSTAFALVQHLCQHPASIEELLHDASDTAGIEADRTAASRLKDLVHNLAELGLLQPESGEST